MVQSLFPDDQHLGLMTDLYELTMAAAYFAQGLAPTGSKQKSRARSKRHVRAAYFVRGSLRLSLDARRWRW